MKQEINNLEKESELLNFLSKEGLSTVINILILFIRFIILIIFLNAFMELVIYFKKNLKKTMLFSMKKKLSKILIILLQKNYIILIKNQQKNYLNYYFYLMIL